MVAAKQKYFVRKEATLRAGLLTSRLEFIFCFEDFDATHDLDDEIIGIHDIMGGRG